MGKKRDDKICIGLSVNEKILYVPIVCAWHAKISTPSEDSYETDQRHNYCIKEPVALATHLVYSEY